MFPVPEGPLTECLLNVFYQTQDKYVQIVHRYKIFLLSKTYFWWAFLAFLIVTKKLFLFNIFSFTLEKLQRCQVLHKTQGHERVHESEFLEMVAGIKKHVFKFFIGLVA